MTITSATILSYIKGKFDWQGQAADAIIERMGADLGQAEAMSRLAKAALFKMSSHYSTYKEFVPDETKVFYMRPYGLRRHEKEKPENRKWLVIDTHIAYRGNFRSTVDAFEYFGERLIADANKLVELMPTLVKEASQSAEGVTTNDCRRSNAVLCSRILCELDATLRALAQQFAPTESQLEDVNWSLASLDHLQHSGFNLSWSNPFGRPLAPPFIKGASEDPVFVKLEEARDTLIKMIEDSRRYHNRYTVAKSKCFNVPQLKRRLAEAPDSDSMHAIMEEIDGAKVEYAAAARARSHGVVAAAHVGLRRRVGVAAAAATEAAAGAGGDEPGHASRALAAERREPERQANHSQSQSRV